jgi:hypothetical protein
MQFIPGESEEDREITKQILRELYSCGVRYQIPHCLPLRGTPSYEVFSKWKLKTFGDNIEDFEYGKFYDQAELQSRIELFSKE